jgi:thiol-disulfide isomerase/thioredoxin
MTGRARAGLVGVLIGLACLGLLAFLLLRPSGAAPEPARSEGGVAFIPKAERTSLPRLVAETLIQPPARLELRSLRGEPVFIDVWASWCPSCKEEAPMLARLARDHRGRVQFVGVDTQDTRGAGRAFVRRYGLDYPHLFDPKSTLATKLGVYGIPTMFLVDREGRIAATLVGKQGETKLRRYLLRLAGE